MHHTVDEEKGFANCAKWRRPGGVLGAIQGTWLPGDAQQEATISEEMATYGTSENPSTQEYIDEVLRKANYVEIERLIGASGFYQVARQHETLAQNAVDPRVRNDRITRKASDGWTYASDPKANTKVHLKVTLTQREANQVNRAMPIVRMNKSIGFFCSAKTCSTGERIFDLALLAARIASDTARPCGFLRWTWLTKPFFSMNTSFAADLYAVSAHTPTAVRGLALANFTVQPEQSGQRRAYTRRLEGQARPRDPHSSPSEQVRKTNCSGLLVQSVAAPAHNRSLRTIQLQSV